MNWKIHGSVIGIMFVVITIMYFAFQPKSPQTIINQLGDNYIRINEAHWGLNCNENYKAYQRRKRTMPPQQTDAPEPKPVVRNNVLPRMSELCDIKAKCEFTADSATLGEAYQYCTKELNLSWRCTTYDRLRTYNGYENDRVVIDCSPESIDKPAQ